MDTKNVIAAISLSAAVIIFYSLFFQTDSSNDKQNLSEEQIKVEKNTDTPSLDPAVEQIKLTRSEALDESKRILFENENIKGSISLKGALIDDLEFKKFKKEKNGLENVTLFNPKNTEDGYYAETGWATTNKNIDLPNHNSIWKIVGNDRLSPNNPIKLLWTNDQGIEFQKDIIIDNKYLFKVNQTIINKSDKSYNFYPYGQIIRNKIPEITNFFILHEGMLGVYDSGDGSELVENNYDDIQDKKFSIEADSGYFGITDRMWVSVILPQKNKRFKSVHDFNDKFRVNFIEVNPTEVKANSSKSNEIKFLLAAKEVRVIDNYADELNVDKLDLVIDWGIFYWLTRPIWSLLDYLYKFCGNYGLAIILATLIVRIVLFPLSQMSFRSMSRMKKLQPEVERIKASTKDDKLKLQKELSALYKREGVNPLSGCVSVIPMIFLFFSLYKVLFVTLDSYHKEFYGWIIDLSAPDPLLITNLFGLIPWDPPSFLAVGLWPVLMGLSMAATQALSPKMPDPVQRKIFAFFPVFLTFILAGFPAALVIFWTINNILQGAQQYIVMRGTQVKTIT